MSDRDPEDLRPEQPFTVVPTPWRIIARSSTWRPPTDVYETDQDYIIRVEVAGMREDDFAIDLENRVITIRGSRPDVNERRAYHQMEIRFGEFLIEVELPGPVLEAGVTAVYANGFLRVTLPKARSRKIPIQEQDLE